MSVKIKCPVCDGKGKVPGDFGGAGCPAYTTITCPACSGTGMQEISSDCYKKWKQCRDRYVPYIPWTPCYPQPWYTTPVTWTVTNDTSCGGLNLSQANKWGNTTSSTSSTTNYQSYNTTPTG
jgi:hypothetical protein